MCHDPFRPEDHLVLVPDKELIRIERSVQFRMYVENTFRSTLKEVRLLVESSAFDIEVQPPVIETLVPGERTFFLVSLKLRDGFEPGDYSLRINAGAKSAELKPSIEKMEVVVEETEAITPEAEPEVKPEDIVEPKVEDVGEVVIRVERFVLAQRYYLYLVPILLLIGVLIWGKLRQR